MIKYAMSVASLSIITAHAQCPAPAPSPTPAPTNPGIIWGVTIDDISNLGTISSDLSALKIKPMARIVFDYGQPASYYRTAAVSFHSIGGVLGELADSSDMKKYSQSSYTSKMSSYLSALGDVVDIWEIGNEVNGAWAGSPSAVSSKVSAAYDIAHNAGKKTALTLYYNVGCETNSAENIWTWVSANLPARMYQGLDYVLISYYEEDCNNLVPDWNSVFTKLSSIFPSAKVGFGEVGTTKTDKAAYMTRYYNYNPPVNNYIKGGFWWYWREDGVPSTQPLWSTLNHLMGG